MTIADNRSRFPQATAFVDAMRQVFGDDVKVVFAQNAAGDTIGRERDDWLPWEDMPTHIDSAVPRSAARGKR